MSIDAVDGKIGSVIDTYFDDRAWTLRYLVVDTTKWLPGGKVLISPLSVRSIDWQHRTVVVSLTREQIKGSPTIDTDKPVTMQRERAYLDYFGYPYYWAGPLRWGPTPFPPGPAGSGMHSGTEYWWEQQRRILEQPEQQGDPHLRSTEAVCGYHIEASDGGIGHVQDFLFDQQDWGIRFLAVDTRNWLPGRHVLIAIDWIERVSWGERKVHVSMTREAIRHAPEWRPELALAAHEQEFMHERSERTPADQPRGDSGRIHR